MKSWRPDTCGCWIEEIYDGTTIIGGGQVLRKCPVHSGVEDKDLYDVIRGDNRRKNMMFRVLLGIDNPELALGLGEVDAKGATVLKGDVEYVWSFTGKDADRVLHATIVGEDVGVLKEAALQAECDLKFGEGKVIIGG